MTPDEAKNIAKADGELCTIHFLSHFRQLLGHGDERYPNTCDVPFSPSWFAQPSNIYNPGLAFAGMGLSLSTYVNDPSNEFRYIRDSMDAFHLDDIDISTYFHRNSENSLDFQDDINLISYAIGHRQIKLPNGEMRTLVICVVRGTSHSVEWVSNADVADFVVDGDYDIPYHEGFKKTADEALGTIARYLDKHGIDTRDALMWIVGHSRGATIVNLLAAFLNEGDDAPFESQGLHFSKERVFAYTFSSSRTTRRKDARSAKFDNIFNVINPEDYIPRIPLKAWKYERFGVDMFMPSVATAYRSYRQYAQAVYDLFLEWTRIKYQAFHGFGKTNLFEQNAGCMTLDVKHMYEDERFSHGGSITFARYFRFFLNVAGINGIGMAEDVGELARYAGGPFEHFLKFFVLNQVIGHAALGAHQEEGYLAKLKYCYEMGIEITGNCKCDTARFTVYGDVDVVVRDGSGKVVARIMDGIVDEHLYKGGDFIAMLHDDDTHANIVWVPLADSSDSDDPGFEDYKVELISHAADPVDITIARQDMLGDVLEQKAYFDVELPKHRKAVWSEDVEPAPSLIWKASEMDPCKVDVAVEGGVRGRDCDAMGVAIAIPGDHVAVHSYHGRGMRFVGWYEEGSDERVSRERMYRFRIEGDRSLIARFE